MAADPVALERVVEPMRPHINQYVTLVRELAGANAKAITLTGAIAAGSFDIERHAARNVLVIDKMDLGLLRRLAEHGVRLGKVHIAAPLVMTPAYIQASLDTFPLELIEIQQNHLTVFGTDYFRELTFEDSHVRLQCERELKTALIGMRQGLLAAAGQEKAVGTLEVQVGEGLVRTLRGMLWLKGERDGKPAAQVLAAVEKSLDRPLSGIRAALQTTLSPGWEQFEALYHDVETLGDRVNAW